MKKQLLALMALGAFVTAAYANPIQIAFSPVNTQPANSGIGSTTTWVEQSIATFNLASYAGSPLPTTLGSPIRVNQGDANPVGSVFGDDVHSIAFNLTGYQYIVLSWGGSNIGKGNADYLYYVNGTGSWTFFNSHNGATGDGTAALANGGLSHITTYGTKVPEAGATIGLIGLGLICVCFFGRRKLA